MPNWENYSFSYNTPTFTTSSAFSITYREWLQEHLQQDCIIEQQMREAEEQCYQEMLKQEEQKKYPLFYWQETCKPIRKK